MLTTWLNKEEKRHGPTGRLSRDSFSILRVVGGIRALGFTVLTKGGKVAFPKEKMEVQFGSIINGRY